MHLDSKEKGGIAELQGRERQAELEAKKRSQIYEIDDGEIPGLGLPGLSRPAA